MEKDIYAFSEKLASKSPTPGGGGVAALCGTMGAALASMVCCLTSGKPKYAQYESEICDIALAADALRKDMLALAEEDGIAFEPLSKAYSLPCATEEEKAEKAKVMEKCLATAADVPFRAVKKAYEAILLHERLVERGSRLAISDVGVGAVVCKSAMQSAALNVYINTKYMCNRELAEKYNGETEKYLKKGSDIADNIYKAVSDMLR